MARPLTVSTVGTPTFDGSIKKFGSHSIFFPDPTSLPDEDYLTTADSAAWDSYGTIDCWIYRTINNAHLIVEQYQDASNYFRVYVTGYGIRVEKNIAGSFTRYGYDGNSTVFALDTWHHLRFCFYTSGARTINFFLNGDRKTLDADGSALAYDNLSSSTTNFSAPLTIGGGTGFVGPTWKEFYLDELLITDTVLTDQSTASFTPPTAQYTAFDTFDGDLLLHFNNNLTDDYPQQGSAVLHALNNFEATANPNPSMVFLGNDQYTWADTNTWDEILNYHDRWLQPEVITAEFGIEAVGTQVRLGDSNINSEFALTCQALNLKRADVSLAMSVSLDVSAENFKDAASTLDSNTTIIVTAEVEVDGRAQLDTVLSLDCSARILKLASLFIDPLATMTVEGQVSVDGRAQLDTEFATAIKAGLLVQVDEPYDYTWDDPASWDEFVLDRWGPQGFLAFSNIQLTALGSRLVDASSVLDTVFNADFQVGLLQDGAADLDAEFTVIAEGKRIQPGESEISSAFAMDVTASLTLEAQAQLDTEFQSQAFAGVVLDAEAELADLLEFGIAAGVIKQDTVELSMAFGIDAIGNTTLDGRSDLLAEFAIDAQGERLVNAEATLECFNFLVSDGISNPAIQAAATLATEFTVDAFGGVIKRAEADLDTEFTVSASAGRVLDAESLLSAFGFVISDGRISDVRGAATLESEFTLTSSSSVAIDGRATLTALGFVVSDGRLSDVRGQATLHMVFGGSFEGDLRLLESGSVFKVISETRTLTVGSEVRALPVLPETRVLEIER